MHRAVEVLPHRSALGEWEMVDAPPHPALRPYVSRYTGYREDTVAPLRRLEVPSRAVTLIVSFGDPLRLVRTPGSGLASGPFTSFVAGLHESPAVTEHDGRQHGIQVGLTPLGAFRLFGVPMRLLANEVVDLAALLGRDGGRLAERLADAPDWPRRFDLLDAALLAGLDGRPDAAPEVVWAWSRLCATDGRASVAELTGGTGWSHRHLVARFRDQVGLAPKAAARVLRFERSLRLMRRAELSLAEVAADAGYYDQAHLNRDFRAFAGCTPTAYLAAHLPGGAGVGA